MKPKFLRVISLLVLFTFSIQQVVFAFEAPRDARNFQYVREYDFRGNITGEKNLLRLLWEERPELRLYFPDPEKKGLWGRWKDKTIADWAREEDWLEDPRLHAYRPQEETAAPELKEAFDARPDLQRRFTDEAGLGGWAERYGSEDDASLSAYHPGRVQSETEAEGAMPAEKGSLTENLAQAAKITVSSQLNNNYHKAFLADGGETTRWLSSTYVNGTSDNEFATLDLARETSLAQIRVDTGANAGIGVSERLRRFTVSLSTDGQNFTAAKEVEGLLSPGWVTIPFSGERARFVKLHRFDTGGNYYAALAEVEIYGVTERTETVTEETALVLGIYPRLRPRSTPPHSSSLFDPNDGLSEG